MSVNDTITHDIIKKNLNDIERVLTRNGDALKTVLEDDSDFVNAIMLLSFTSMQPGLDALAYLIAQLTGKNVSRVGVLKILVRVYESESRVTIDELVREAKQ